MRVSILFWSAHTGWGHYPYVGDWGLYAGEHTAHAVRGTTGFMSLRLRIVLLVLLAILTPAALLGIYLFEDRRGDVAEAKQDLNILAGYAAENLSDKIHGTVQILHVLSRLPDLDGTDRAICSAFLGDVLKRYPQYTGLLTIRPDGQLHCDSLASGRTLDLNDRAYFGRARVSGEPAFEVVFGRLTGVAVLQIAYPVRDTRGALKYVLLASLNLAQFGERFAKASAQGTQVTLWDAKGTLMVRYPDDGPRKLVGTLQAQSDLYRFVATQRGGETAELPGPDGVAKIWALGVLSVARESGLRIALGIPRAVLLAKAEGDLRHALAILAGASLLAFIGAFLFAELGIRRHVARIAKAAARQGKGDLNARIGMPYPRGELGGLMETLDDAAASVQTQQLEGARKSEELGRINRTLRVLSAINSTIVRVHKRDELLDETCRIAAEDGQFPIVWVGLLDRATKRVKPVAWRGVDLAYVESVRLDLEDPEALVSQALRERRAVVANDIAGDVRLSTRGAALAMGSRSLATFPLIVSGKAAGVLVLHARETGFFDGPEMKLLNELAGDVAFALEYIEKAERLHYLAYYDPLTGLPNRVLFHERLDQYLGMAAREGRGIALVLADIERFRGINDAFGRPLGDELLRQVAARASHEIGDERWLARIGPDHFAFIIPDETGPDGMARRIDQIHREVFSKPLLLSGTELRVTARFGVARFPGDGADADALFRNAEAALRNAQVGGERHLFYTPRMTEQISERLTLENKLRLALENQEFVLHYQPKVDLESKRIVGVEALIRWQSPELGLVSPMRFIPLLEETGLILQVGAWALERAALDHREWRDADVSPPRVAVNVSAIQLRQRDFVQVLEHAIELGVAPTGIDLEITESLMMDDIEGNIRKLHAIRDLGVSIAIDDFGTGHSSLAYLGKLPVHTLKIDRSFVITMLNDTDTMRMVSTIISLAHSLRLKVVAEGVDSDEQAKILRLLRCDQMQGYLFSRPMPKLELLQLLRQEV